STCAAASCAPSASTPVRRARSGSTISWPRSPLRERPDPARRINPASRLHPTRMPTPAQEGAGSVMSVTGKKARALAWVLIGMLSSSSVAGCGGLREAGNGGRQAVNPPDRKSAGRLNVLENRGAEQANFPGKAIVAFENIDNRMYADAE